MEQDRRALDEQADAMRVRRQSGGEALPHTVSEIPVKTFPNSMAPLPLRQTDRTKPHQSEGRTKTVCGSAESRTDKSDSGPLLRHIVHCTSR